MEKHAISIINKAFFLSWLIFITINPFCDIYISVNDKFTVVRRLLSCVSEDLIVKLCDRKPHVWLFPDTWCRVWTGAGPWCGSTASDLRKVPAVSRKPATCCFSLRSVSNWKEKKLIHNFCYWSMAV